MIKELNLEEMLEVYEYIREAVLEVDEKSTLGVFVDKVLEHLKQNPRHYVRMVELFTGASRETIIAWKTKEVLEVFMEGMSKNQVLTFHLFWQQLSCDVGVF